MRGKGIVVFLSLVVFAALLAFAAGCGDNGTTAATQASAEKSGDSDNGGSIDACDMVTQQDATKLFGQPAVKEKSDTLVLDANMLGECLWSYDAELGSQLIQFRIWNGEQYYGPTPNSQPFDIGDKGTITVSEFAGVDIEWVQDGKTVTLSYFTTGSGVPDATTKAEEVKALARQASDKL